MEGSVIYRGFEIEKDRDGKWIVMRNGEHVHVAQNQDDAMAWVDAQREAAYRRSRSGR